MTARERFGLSIFLGCVLGSAVCGLVSAAVMYEIAIRFPYDDSFFGREDGARIMALMGLIFGGSGGLLVGASVSVFRLRILTSFVIGLLINGFMPVAAILLLGGGLSDGFGLSDNSVHSDATRSWHYSLIGQAMVGAVVGMTVFC